MSDDPHYQSKRIAGVFDRLTGRWICTPDQQETSQRPYDGSRTDNFVGIGINLGAAAAVLGRQVNPRRMRPRPTG